jgi:light-regulated signal transduction histidine kinase (bacteriophytochrome)
VNTDLRRSNDDLERFAFIASHDLQEPLRNVSISSQLLVRLYPAELVPQAKLFVDRIFDGATRMRELLTDLRSYVEIAASRKSEAENVDLTVAFDCAVQNLESTISESNATVTAGRLPIVTSAYQSDFIALFQNLIGNAIKYRGPEPPRIHASVRRKDGEEFEIAVSDNGIGIAPEYHAKIFQPFIRLHGREIPGTGIGLAICQRVVDRYHGRIWVESSLGQGATFLFSVSGVTTKEAAHGVNTRE